VAQAWLASTAERASQVAPDTALEAAGEMQALASEVEPSEALPESVGLAAGLRQAHQDRMASSQEHPSYSEQPVAEVQSVRQHLAA